MLKKERYPYVSIIVIVYNMKDTISRCLRSLESLDYPRDRYEVIVVDGGSTDGTQEIIKKFDVKFILEEKKVRGFARNVGVKHARGEIIAFIDADCEAASDWLKVHVKAHASNRLIGAVGGSVINPHQHLDNKFAVLTHCEDFAEFNVSNPARYMYHIPTCNASFKRHALEKAGLFDENLHAYEDFLLSRKITDMGFKILFESKAKVLHIRNNHLMNLNSYIKKEKKRGQAHFLAQTVNKHIFGRLPMNPLLVLPFMPLIATARTCRELYKLRRLFNLTKYISYLPHIVMGGLAWSFGYTKEAFSHSKRKQKLSAEGQPEISEMALSNRNVALVVLMVLVLNLIFFAAALIQILRVLGG